MSSDSVGPENGGDRTNLEANTFGKELADLDSDTHKRLVEESLQSAEHEFRDRSTDSFADYEGRHSDDVAALWGTPKGEWWP